MQNFLRERIDAFEQLEVLLLLREHRAQPWNAHAVASALRCDVAQALAALEHLRSSELLADGGIDRHFSFSPRDEALAADVGAVLEAYQSARFEVLMFVSQCAMERIRSAHVRTFAQAFLLRDPNKKGRP